MTQDFKTRILEEGLKNLLPYIGAAGLGYAGYNAGDDFADGLEAANKDSSSITGMGKQVFNSFADHPIKELSSDDALRKFITPGQDGSWREAGYAVGKESIPNGNIIPESLLNNAQANYRTSGAMMGTGAGILAGQIAKKIAKR